MAYAHDKNVIHRDLKPANVMVGKFGEVYVMDWGLAKILGREDGRDLRVQPEGSRTTTELRSDRGDRALETPDSPIVTMDGDVVGTPAYMSPEQAQGRVGEMGPASDVYAVGAMLFHLLGGHMPYVPPGVAANNYAVWRSVQEGPPKALHEVAPQVPAELVAICEKGGCAGRGDRRDRVRLQGRSGRAVSGRGCSSCSTGRSSPAGCWRTRRASPRARACRTTPWT